MPAGNSIDRMQSNSSNSLPGDLEYGKAALIIAKLDKADWQTLPLFEVVEGPALGIVPAFRHYAGLPGCLTVKDNSCVSPSGLSGTNLLSDC